MAGYQALVSCAIVRHGGYHGKPCVECAHYTGRYRRIQIHGVPAIIATCKAAQKRIHHGLTAKASVLCSEPVQNLLSHTGTSSAHRKGLLQECKKIKIVERRYAGLDRKEHDLRDPIWRHDFMG